MKSKKNDSNNKKDYKKSASFLDVVKVKMDSRNEKLLIFVGPRNIISLHRNYISKILETNKVS